MKKLIFVTESKDKLREAQEILGSNISIANQKIDLPEIQAIDSEHIVEEKSKEAFKRVNMPVFVEDTSIFFDAWNGLPGALIKWFWDSVGDRGICRMMANEKNRKATAKSVIGYHDGSELKTFVGQISGTVPMEPKGGGFWWDSIFIPDGFDKTFGEIGPAKKNEISMRKKAFAKFRDYLNSTIN